MQGALGGLSASDFLDHQLLLQTPFGIKETQTYFGNQGGKNRMRLLDSRNRQWPHVAPFLAAMLMLPECVREENKVSSSLPVLLDKRYILDVAFSHAILRSDDAVLTPSTLLARSGDLQNTASQTTLSIPERCSELSALYAKANELPPLLRGAVLAHRDAVSLDGQFLYKPARDAVRTILQTLPSTDPYYLPTADPLPTLLHLVGIRKKAVQAPLPPETPPDLEIRLRADRQYREMFRLEGRNKKARKFAADVAAAYNDSCLFCGLHAPSDISFRRGVDAAHILPWSTYDIDEVPNGLALCLQHHWAFDAHLLTLDYTTSGYHIKKGPTFERIAVSEPANKALLSDVIGKVPDSRLPEQHLRPGKNLLDKLNETFAV